MSIQDHSSGSSTFLPSAQEYILCHGDKPLWVSRHLNISQNTQTIRISTKSSPNCSNPFPTWLSHCPWFFYVFRIFYFSEGQAQFNKRAPDPPKTSTSVRIGQYCTKPLGLFIDMFIKIIPNFLSIQNNLYRQGTVRYQFNEWTASHTT